MNKYIFGAVICEGYGEILQLESITSFDSSQIILSQTLSITQVVGGIHLLHRIPSQSFGTISRDAKAEKLNMQQQRQLNGNTIPIRVITGQPTSWIEISKLSLIAVAAAVAAAATDVVVVSCLLDARWTIVSSKLLKRIM